MSLRKGFNFIPSSVLAVIITLFITCIYFNIGNDVSAQTRHSSELEQSALKRVGQTLWYDGTYQTLKYPLGDVDNDRGVCTDVVIRSYRDLGIDFQQLVHEDMLSNFSEYPNNWGLKRPDSNIDHRHVPNLRKYFERYGASLPVSDNPKNFKSGDIVSWVFPNNLNHIGIVISHKTLDGQRPLIVHNVGSGTEVEDFLFKYEITGHYRYFPEPSISRQ